MKTFSNTEIEIFLLAIDKNLEKPTPVIIIGGAASALAYQVSRFTKDIDTVGSFVAIEKAYNAAKKITGLEIPMGPVGIEDGPERYQDRLLGYPLAGVRHLTILVPERHDLVLMKTLRGQQNDLETAAEIHHKLSLSYDRLVGLIRTEMKHVIGDKRQIKQNFFALIEKLFGDTIVRDAEKQLRNWERT